MVKWNIFLKVFGGMVAFVAALITIVAFANPNLRQWLAHHGLAGWEFAVALVILIPVLMTLIDRSQAKISKIEKDRDLILERLDGWVLGSDFYEYLQLYVNHSRFRRDISDEIFDTCIKWNMDNREIKNRRLRSAFEGVKEATEKYNEILQGETWAWDTGPQTEIDYKYVRVPPEWEHTDPPRFERALKDLASGRKALVIALDHLFKVLHDTATG